MSDFDLREVLKLCKSSASNGDKIAKQKLTHLNSSLLDAQNQVQQDIAWLENSECSLPEMSEALKKQLSDIQSSFMSLSKVSDSDLRYLRKHLSKFSITLFGRTMAGKSTLMEILRHGDGASIGKGAQRTTRDIRTYEWNGLTITDVPGIGAFEGAEDEALAFNAAKSADLIMFLITDDAPQAIEGDCFSRIVKLGKPVICVMNVKAAVNPERSPKMIERTIKGRFDIERLDSIKNQFLQYAKKAGQEWSNIPFVYVHLKAAFMSQSVSESNPEFSERLYELSCIDSLKQLLVDCVRENGVFYRTKTFIDIIDNPMIATTETLINQCQENSLQARTIESKRKSLESWRKSFKTETDNKIRYLITKIKSELRQEVAQFAEDHFEDSHADKAWEAVLREKKVEDRCKQLLEDANKRINQRVSEIARELQNEMHYNSVISADRSLRKDSIIDGRKIWNWSFEIAGAGVSIAWIITSLLGAAAAGPLGWIAVGVAAVGFLGSLFFKSREKKEKEARQKLEAELRKNIDSICDKLTKDMKKQCESMLSQQIDSLLKELNRVIQVISNLSRVQSQLAWQINGHVLDINRQLLHSGLDVLQCREPINDLKVARLPGNICIVILPEGAEYTSRFKTKLSKLMSESIHFIAYSEDKSKLITRVLNTGARGKSSNKQYEIYIDTDNNIAHVKVNYDDPNVLNRINLAQQVTELVITK